MASLAKVAPGECSSLWDHGTWGGKKKKIYNMYKKKPNKSQTL